MVTYISRFFYYTDKKEFQSICFLEGESSYLMRKIFFENFMLSFEKLILQMFSSSILSLLEGKEE